MLRKWAVNMRLELNGYSIPREIMKWILTMYAKECKEAVEGFYKKFNDGSLAFIGCPEGTSPFAYSFGWFPAVFPYDDPYQAVHKGMTAEEFENFLKMYGFKEIE